LGEVTRLFHKQAAIIFQSLASNIRTVAGVALEQSAYHFFEAGMSDQGAIAQMAALDDISKVSPAAALGLCFHLLDHPPTGLDYSRLRLFLIQLHCKAGDSCLVLNDVPTAFTQ